MKKIVLFLFLSFFLFGFIKETLALSYGGIPNFWMPNIMTNSPWYDTFVALPEFNTTVSYPTIATTLSWSIEWTLSHFVTHTSCYKYTATSWSWYTLSWNIMYFNNWFIRYNYWAYDWAYPVFVNAEYISDSITRISLVTTNYLSAWDPTTKFSLMDIPTFPNSTWDNPNDGVFCVSPSFWIVPYSESDWFNWMYLHSVKYSYYHWSTWIFWIADKFFTQNSVYWYKYINLDLFDSHNRSFFALGHPSSWPTLLIQWEYITFPNVESITYWKTVWTNADVSYFLSSLSDSWNLNIPSLPIFFNSISSTTWSLVPSTNTGWTNTWSVSDYFTDCWSFLDVGCYVKWAFNGTIDKIKWFFTWIWTWILPDFNINWNWVTSDCATFQWNSSTWITITSSSWSVWVLQRFANFISVVSPFPPTDWSVVCLLDWSIKTVDYKSDTINFFDIIVILICILPILFASHHTTTKPS